jgi:hypothetical protein
MDLDDECSSILQRSSRLVPDDARDEFFAYVAGRLRNLRYVHATDTRAVCAQAVQIYAPGWRQKRQGLWMMRNAVRPNFGRSRYETRCFVQTNSGGVANASRSSNKTPRLRTKECK